MWRTLFLAIGISLCLLGAETLVVDKAILSNTEDRLVLKQSFGQDYFDDFTQQPRKVVVPPEWAPWSLLSAGIVVVLYAMSIKGGGGDD